MSGYTNAEFAAKADYEGGYEEAIFGYGLTHTSLEVQEGPFYEAVKELTELAPRVRELTERLYSLEGGLGD